MPASPSIRYRRCRGSHSCRQRVVLRPEDVSSACLYFHCFRTGYGRQITHLRLPAQATAPAHLQSPSTPPPPERNRARPPVDRNSHCRFHQPLPPSSPSSSGHTNSPDITARTSHPARPSTTPPRRTRESLPGFLPPSMRDCAFRPSTRRRTRAAQAAHVHHVVPKEEKGHPRPGPR